MKSVRKMQNVLAHHSDRHFLIITFQPRHYTTRKEAEIEILIVDV